jgi:beta-galactosidase
VPRNRLHAGIHTFPLILNAIWTKSPLFRVLLALLSLTTVCAATSPRRAVSLDADWRTTLATSIPPSADCTTPAFDDSTWRRVDVPHNWDAYEGVRQTRHGNLHGSAWYRRTFTLAPDDLADSRRAFLFFRGVGSRATVWVNGREVGRHAGGLTTFTLDVTDAVRAGQPNTLVVRADHPAGIRDLPWVCGGCELVNGFSEGPQPFGIFRSVDLVTTAPVRIEPFGIHAWNDADVSAARAAVHLSVEVRNHGSTPRTVTVAAEVTSRAARRGTSVRTDITLAPGETRTVRLDPPALVNPDLWSPEKPGVYDLVVSLWDGDRLVDRDEDLFGIRSVRWPDPNGPADQPLLVNGAPVFLNGTCDYEHNLGANHACTRDQIHARVAQMRAAGFNAFRDAHHPHDLAFNQQWDTSGMLWWTQFGAQIWFDRDDFRANYTRLLRQWVKERRNSPSLILWGLQNESKLPTAFAEECVAIIREMDPTASTQRLITTCNGGTGTDWDVPQNWTGTYGGDPLTYADDLRRQRLVGEYGAWRSLGLHAEGAPGVPVSADDPSRFASFAAGPNSEERFNALMETKIRLAESVRDRSIGHFQWPFTTHANPGRNFGENGEQLFDGFRPLDRTGPANNKGLFTLWGEPTDAYHLYRSNYTSPQTNPMVAIMSRTWPGRWTEPGRKSGIVVYSNCEEVELFNDLGDRSLGVRHRGGPGTHFRWDDVSVETNYLRAEARVGGRVVATDAILLHHLPPAPRYTAADAAEDDLLAPVPGSITLHRINCGGPDYVDRHGQLWGADRGVTASWADDYPHLPPEFASQRRIYEPIAGTRDDPLFQSFRYGRDRLRFSLPVPNGAYEVDLFLTEPWYGAGRERDCTGWRKFDVTINNRVAVSGVDPWARGNGHARALKQTAAVDVTNGRIEIGFRVDAGQAVISAIAVRTKPGLPMPSTPAALPKPSSRHTHLDLGDRVYFDADTTLAVLPATSLESDLVRTAASGALPAPLRVTRDTHVTLAHDTRIAEKPAWLATWERTGQQAATAGPHAARFDLLRRFVPADTEIVFGPNRDSDTGAPASMYFVILEPARPLPGPQFVEALTTSTGKPWRAHGHLKSGHPHYTDGTARFTAIPAAFGDGDWLLPPARSSEPVSATFTAPVQIEVALGLDARIAARPAWLDAWIPMTWSITSTDPDAARFTVLRRRFTPGEPVRLGDNGRLPDGSAAAMYAVLVRPVRASATFYAVAEPAGARWTLAVHVGDRYGLNFRHRTATTEPLQAPYSIIASDGAVVCSGTLGIAVPPSPDTWQIARIRTCDSLNAGTYVLRVELPAGAARVEFDTLEVE